MKNIENNNYLKWYLKVVKDNFFNSKGRARRKEFWMFILVHSIFFLTLGFIGVMFAATMDYYEVYNDIELIGFVPQYVYLLITLPPLFTVTIRRLHDIGRSASSLLIWFIPFIGWLWLLILLCEKGEGTENKFGVNPKSE